jgi:Sodium:dicarboxylate symporter family
MRLATTNTAPPRRPWYRPSRTTQIFIGLIIGGFLGWISPQ